MHAKGLQPTAALLILFLISSASAANFVELPTSIVALGNGAQAWGDLDDDGYLDLLFSGGTGGDNPEIVATLYWNLGNGQFRAATNIFEPMSRGNISLIDFDRDGHLDVFITGENNKNGWTLFTKLYRNNGNGQFSNLNLPLPTGQVPRAAWGDYDNDGDLDLVFSTIYSGSFVQGTDIYRNDNGQFHFVQRVFEGYGGTVQWVDVDGDGILELLVGGQSSTRGNQLLTFTNHNGTFVQSAQLGEEVYSAFGRAQDLDGDGKAELVVLPSLDGPLSPASIFSQAGGRWQALQQITPLGAYSGALWGDVDNDGLPELLLHGSAIHPQTSRATEAWIYPSRRGAIIDLPQALGPPGGSCQFVDVDGDGDLDIFRFDDGCFNCPPECQLLMNQGSNSRPSAPINLHAQQLQDGSWELDWLPGRDAETTNSAFFSYDIRLGNKPGNGGIISAPANLETGIRKVSAPGMLSSTRRLVAGLTKGDYFWSVQAMDSAYFGSAWAAEASFTVTNTAPSIELLTSTNIAMSALTEIVFRVSDLESPPETLIVRASSLSEDLLPNRNVSIQGTGENRVLVFRPASGKSGSGKLVVTAQEPNGGLVSTHFVDVTVQEFSAEPAVTFPYEVFGVQLQRAPPADYDGDGDLDVYISGQRRRPDQAFESFTVLLKNDGHGHFFIGPDITNGIPEIAADLDHNGTIDLLSGATQFLNHGDGTFVAQPTGVPDGSPIFASDLDGDGELDMLSRFYDGSVTDRVYFRRGSIWEESKTRLPRAGSQGLFYAADFNGDGMEDILIGGFVSETDPSQNLAKLFLNSGDGRFQEIRNLPGLPPWPPNVSWVEDNDDDGDLDIVTVENGTTNFVRYTNDGRGNFTTNRIDYAYNPVRFDYDNDGDSDFFSFEYLSAGNYLWRLEKNQGNGTFKPTDLKILNEAPHLIGDFDGDGDLDVLAMGVQANADGTSTLVPFLFRNSCDRPNNPPASPSALTADVDPGGPVTLRWQAATDDNTPTALLTYNLRVGRTPEGIDVVAPNQMIAHDGNSARTLIRHLNSLPAGKYYWSVQAVDGQFKAGAWSTEAVFTVDLPGIAPVADFTTAPSEPTRAIRISVKGDSTTSPDALAVFATSDNPNIVPPTGLDLSGSGAERQLVITPSAHQGSALIEISARDTSGRSGTTRFRVTVAQFDKRLLAPTALENTSSATSAGLGNHNFLWTDIDADGALDLLGLYLTDGTFRGLTAWHNRGNGEMKPITNVFPTPFSGRFSVGDWDGDNRPDFFFTGISTGSWDNFTMEARIWSPADNSQLIAQTPQLTTPDLLGTYLDHDHDGFADTLFWNPRSAFTRSSDWLSSPVNVPRPVVLDPPLLRIAGEAWADLDGDGDLDYLLSGSKISNGFSPENWVFRVWENQAGRFVPTTTSFPTNFYGRITAADLDGDGLPEVFLGPIYSSSSYPPQIWRNLGHFQFVQAATNFPSGYGGLPAVGDYDNDGEPDLLLTAPSENDFGVFQNQTALLYRNNGNLNFELTDVSTFPNLPIYEGAWADANGDGTLDLALVGDSQGSGERWVYINQSTKSNAPPSAPSGLKVERVPGGVLLGWNRADDREDKRFLTYNLRVGTTPGGSEILSALADPLTGRRRLSGPGNAAPVPLWRMSGLPKGTYYWAVQSVDAGYAGSPFAPESSFRVSPPVITAPTNLVVLPNVTSGPFTFSVNDAETPAIELKASFSSRNEEIIPTRNIRLEGTGVTRTIQFTPTPRRGGIATLVLNVEDADGEIATAEINVTVHEEFALIDSPLPSLREGVAAWADVDGDGDLDLLIGGFRNIPFNEGDGRSDIWRNDGGIITSNILASFNDAGAGAVAFADANHDGLLDLFVSGGRGTANLYFSVAHPEAAIPPRALAPSTRSAAGWGDLNSDGASDLMVIGSESEFFISRNISAFYLNQLPATFSGSFSTYIPQQLREGAVVWFDMDNDGDDDLLLTGSRDFNSGAAQTLLFANNHGQLTLLATDFPQLAFSSAAVADIDLDGLPDLVLSGQRIVNNATERITQLFHNEGSGHFTPLELALPPYFGAQVAWGDYDGNGYPDLLISGVLSNEFRTELWYNIGGQLIRSENHFAGKAARGLAFGDMDNDGDLDLALAGLPQDFTSPPSTPPFTGLFRNEVNHGGAPPPAPIALHAEADGTDVLLSWQMPAAAPKGLTFNVRAGSFPGAIDIISPLAEASTGRRLVPANGNAGWSFKRRLSNWAGKPFYWSVQTIDPAFRASPFAPEQKSLVMRNDPPIISEVPTYKAIMNQEIGPITFSVTDPDNDPSTLRITVSSSNQALVANGSIRRNSAGSLQILTMMPLRNANGTTQITITATDPLGSSVTNQFRVIVMAISEIAAGLPQFRPYSLEPADYDGNGTVDLFFGGADLSGTGYSAILTNSGTGQFSVAISDPLPGGNVHAAWGDMNNDGYLDLFAGLLFYENGLDQFTGPVPSPNPDAFGAWADFNGDGLMDAAAVGGIFRLFQLFQNNSGDFISIDLQPPLADATLAWGDPDNDGDLDLAITGRDSDFFSQDGRLYIFRNDGGVFTQVRSYKGVTSGTLQWADVNRDGRADLIMAGSSLAGARERLLLNIGDFDFLDTDLGQNSNGVPALPGALLFDFDNDGDLDLAEHTPSATFGVRLNNGFGLFTNGVAAFDNVPAKILRVADLDNDADFDLIVGGNSTSSGGIVKVYRNEWLSDSQAVSQLTALVRGNEVTLQWPIEQNFGNGSPVTYNLRVGSKPGGIDALSPLSNPKTGTRLLPAHGNMGFARQTKLRLPPRTYYWSVQPIDSAWRGGPFAPESTFTIVANAHAPKIEKLDLSFSTVQLSVRGAPGNFIVVESSTDLRSWSSQSTNFISSADQQLIRAAHSGPLQFFRLRSR